MSTTLIVAASTCWLISISQVQPSASPLKKAAVKSKSAGSADSAAVRALEKPFFKGILAGEYKNAMDGLSKAFAISEGKRDYLVDRLSALEKKLGRAVSYERLGQRKMVGSERVMVVYYATYHPLKPAIWEIVYYKAPASGASPERWMVTAMRFETEKIFELLEGLKS